MRTDLFKKFTVVISVLFVSVLIVPRETISGEYHASASNTLACSQCHTMHGTQGAVSLAYDGSGLNPVLLRASSVMGLCKNCHANDQTIGTVKPPLVINNTRAYTSSAGDFKSGNFAVNRNRHDVERDVSSIEPPGFQVAPYTWANVISSRGTEFSCIFCHEQHGNTNYRNLRYDPRNSLTDNSTDGVNISYATIAGQAGDGCSGETAPTTDVLNCTAGPLAGNEANLNKYDRDNVAFGIDDASGVSYNRISEWCGKCHSDFFAESGGGNGGATAGGIGAGDNGTPWTRHPVGDIEIETLPTGGNGHTDSEALLSVAGVRYADNTGLLDSHNSDEQPLCLSCHFAHGGGNANTAQGGDGMLDHSNLVKFDGAGVINLDESTYAISGANAGYMRNTCQACHNQ